jgi:hypothetical protein
MSNRTYVCFTCRTTERVPLARVTRRCRKCRAPSEHVYHKFRIPRADDDTGWSELMRKVREVNDVLKTDMVRRLRERAEKYERQLAAARADDPRSIRLKAHLRELQERLAEWETWR